MGWVIPVRKYGFLLSLQIEETGATHFLQIEETGATHFWWPREGAWRSSAARPCRRGGGGGASGLAARGGSDRHLRERDKAWSAVGAGASVGDAVAGYGLSARKKEGIETDVWGHVAGISTHIPCISNQTRTRNQDDPNPHNQTRNGFTPFQKSWMDPAHPSKSQNQINA
jgi:hypothetical protein